MRWLFIIFLIKGVLMSAELKFIEVEGVEVPIIFEHSNTIPIVNLQLIFRDSGSIEDGKKEGLSKLSSLIMGEGTKKDGATGFATKLESRAINLTVGSGIETFYIDYSSLKEEFGGGVKLISELLKDPNLTKDSLAKIKERQIGKLLAKESDFDYIANQNLNKIIFANTPIAHPSSGSIDSIKNIDLKSIKEFLDSHLTLKRLIVLAGGDIEFDELKKSLSPILKLLKKGKKYELPFFEASGVAEVSELERKSEQAYIYFGSPLNIKPNDKNYYKAKVAAFILGSSGFGSRIMEEIRVKRGLAYSAYMRFNVHKSHSYAFGYLQTKLESQEEAIKVIRETVDEFVKNGATQKELDDAKKFILGSEPLRNETLSQRLGRAFDEYYKGLPLGFHIEELEAISLLTLNELNSFIKEHSEIEKLTFSVVSAEKNHTK